MLSEGGGHNGDEFAQAEVGCSAMMHVALYCSALRDMRRRVDRCGQFTNKRCPPCPRRGAGNDISQSR